MTSQLKANTPVFILAATSDWFQIETVDGNIGFLYKNLLTAVDSTALDSTATYALINPFSTTDSLLVNLKEFSSIGVTSEGYDMIVDKDGNLLYLPALAQQ